MSCILLLLSLLALETTVGVPVEVDYGLPEGWQAGVLESTGQWVVLTQDSGVVSLLPLDLDTLYLPLLPIWNNNGDTLLLEPPLLVVTRTMPDTLYTPAVFPYPAILEIPPGFPGDYLEMLRFWLAWGDPPGIDWFLICLIVAAVLTCVFVVILVVRKKRRGAEEPDAPAPPPAKRSAEALALLDSIWFAEGRWQELYKDVDRLLRNTIDWKFGVANRALTYGQVVRKLRKDQDGNRFMEEAEPLIDEIVLQRYAGWGSSRERTQRFIRMLANIMETWI
jgi:hypothetical protein